jgi:hypothetical protein
MKQKYSLLFTQMSTCSYPETDMKNIYHENEKSDCVYMRGDTPRISVLCSSLSVL